MIALRRIEERGALETAHRAQQNIGEVFRYAVASLRATSNPTDALRGLLPPVKYEHFQTITEPAQRGRSVTGQGIDCGTDCAESLAVGSPIGGLIATAASGYQFAGWNSPACGTGFTLAGDTECVASFSAVPTPVACTPNSGAFNLSDGLPMDSAACFSSTVSVPERSGTLLHVLQTEPVTVNTRITADPAHVGQAAQIAIVVRRLHNGQVTWYARHGNVWRPWWLNLANLPVSENLASLPVEHTASVVLDITPRNLTGVFTLYTGYRVGNTLVHNAAYPAQVVVANSLVYNPAEKTQTPGYAYFDGLIVARGEAGASEVWAWEVFDAGLKVYPDPAHLSQRLDVLTVGKMIRAGGTSHEMLLSSRNWVSWLPETDPLLAAFQVVLQPGMGLGMYHGALQIPGDYRGYVGYRLNDGRIVYNGLEPLGVGVR